MGIIKPKIVDVLVPLSCCLIGEDTLLVSCGDVLLSRGHNIIAVVSSKHPIKTWAREHGITCFDSITEAENILKTYKFDYLFSIANGQILQTKHIQLPQKLAINYHYSLLPRYAGTYATSWAILNDEKIHGITWHVITSEIDAGDILKQKQIKIDQNETSLTLNLKCFEHAIPTFVELVSELEGETYVLKKQDLSLRNYSLLSKRPPQNGLIFWGQSAHDINKLHRVLTFGNYLNQLGVLKLMIETDIFHVQTLHISSIRSIAAPGTITAITATELQIATTTFDVVISNLYSLEGCFVVLAELIQQFKLAVEIKLPIPEPAYFAQLEQTGSQYVKYENYWLAALSNIVQGKEQFFAAARDTDKINSTRIALEKIPEIIYTNILTDKIVAQRRDILLTAVLICLYRLNNYDNFSCMFAYPELPQANTQLAQFYATHLPLHSKFTAEINFREALQIVTLEIEALKKNQTYTRDISLRYPQLAHCVNLKLMSIEIVHNVKTYTPKPAPFSVIIAQDGSEMSVFINDNLLSITYLSNLMQNFTSHVLALLNDIEKDPKQAISSLQILTPLERQQILLDWNNTAQPITGDKTIHELFEEQALRTPNSIAVIFKNEVLTFEELNQKANQLAHYLSKYAALLPETLVAICAERSLEMVIAILAVLKSGWAYIPLDPKYPSERLAYMLEDSKAAILLLSDMALVQNFPTYSGHIVDLAEEQQTIVMQSKMNLLNKATTNCLAYIIYTSGTTGKPKGVIVPHSALVNHMLWMIKKFNFTEKDIFLQKTPFSFDASIWEFFAPLLCGGKLIMASSGEPAEIINLVKEHAISILQLVPSLLKHFLEDPQFQTCSSLQQVFSGGETLLPDTVGLFFKKMYAKLHNLYGPTETTIQVVTHSYDLLKDKTEDAVLIGKPIDNTQVYVLDSYLNPVPVGLIGELYIGGRCLAKGYLNNDNLTATKFINNPFNQVLSRSLYKTGDMVRWLVDGSLEYIGRSDNQVKFNGFRLELSDIEATLLQHTLILDCAVVVQESSNHNRNATTNKCLVAYYVRKYYFTYADIESFLKFMASLHDERYASLDITFKKNPKGWNDSYTNKEINHEQMSEWVDNTTDRIKGFAPHTILEIGSGSGLMLFNMLDSCEHYYATDFSSKAINYTKTIVSKMGCNEKVAMFNCSADDIPYQSLGKPYDTVVINSVIQYFPSIEYLEEVITGAISNMSDIGQIFIGDVRDFRLLKCFHYSVLSYKHENVTRSKVEFFALRDKELLVSPEYFIYLQKKNCEISHVEILPKLGSANNEMNNYRYDVILHIRKNNNNMLDVISASDLIFVNTLDFEQHVNANIACDFIYIKYINKRLVKDYQGCNNIYNTESKINTFDYNDVLSIKQIIDFSDIKNFKAKFFVDIADPLYLYVVLFKDSKLKVQNIFIEYTLINSTVYNNLASKPLATQKFIEEQFANELKEFMHTKLPSYMVPAIYTQLETMPLNIHGKIDKTALIELEFTRSDGYLAPKSICETQLRSIWAQVLGLPEDSIGIQDDFFDLGGQSLSVVKALLLVKQIFVIQLPTRTFFDYPTIEKLAAFIQQSLQNPVSVVQKNIIASPLITLQQNGFKTPLFLIHPLGGTVFWYKALTRYLGTSRPIYAIQDPGIQAKDFLFKSLPEMANYYLKIIKEVQPRGPYLLAGVSLGGTIAIEMANQLLQAKDKVNFVGLLDSFPIHPNKFWDKEFLEKMMLQQLQKMSAQFSEQNVYDVEFLLQLYQHRSLMLRDYTIPTLETRLTFFKAKERWPVFKEMILPLNCWQHYSSKPVDVHVVLGNHETMFWEPHVQSLAKKINSSLEKIDGQQHLASRDGYGFKMSHTSFAHQR